LPRHLKTQFGLLAMIAKRLHRACSVVAFLRSTWASKRPLNGPLTSRRNGTGIMRCGAG
jgi:hypothetical protein